MSEMRKLADIDANDILDRMSIDEVDEGHREEVWIEEENGVVVDNWFVGPDGAVSYSGTALTTEAFAQKVEISYAEARPRGNGAEKEG